MTEESTFGWTVDGVDVPVGMTTLGSGPKALLLPAMSSISTRREMLPLQRELARNYRTVAIDWPGFGTDSKPYVDWTPATMAGFLRFVLRQIAADAVLIVAAGHAAGYLLREAAAIPSSVTEIALVAPTWRGPFPTMMNGDRGWFARVRKLVDTPLFGPLVYKLNVNAFVVRHMAAGHVYADTVWLDESRLQEKLAVTRAVGARHGSVRFVTGGLDPFASREAFLAAARDCAQPIKAIYGADTPRKSKAEMEALGAVEGVEAIVIPAGKLAVHEEHPDLVAQAIRT